VNAEEMRYSHSTDIVSQVSALEQICSHNDIRYYVASGITFHRASAYTHYHMVRTFPNGDISVLNQYTFEHAKAACYHWADRTRAEMAAAEEAAQ